VWDEFSHWGPMIRETVRLSDFHNNIESVLGVHRDYPPGVTLFQYFFIRLAGGFSQQNVFRALQLLTLSLMFPVFSRIKNKLVVVCVFVVMLLLPDAFGISTYAIIYTDTILGVLLGLSIYLVMTKPGTSLFYLINLYLVSITMVLTKQMGLLLMFIPVMLLTLGLIKGIVVNRKELKYYKKDAFIQVKSLGVILLGALVGQLTWSGRLNSVNIDRGQFSVTEMINDAFNILRGDWLPHQYVVLSNYLEAVFTRPVMVFFDLPFFGVFVLLTVASTLLYLYSKRLGEEKCLLPVAIGAPLGVLIYGVAMLFIYLVGFYESESVNLASYHRYMATVNVGFGVGLFMILMNMLAKKDLGKLSSKIKVLLFTGLFCVMAIPGMAYYEILIAGSTPGENYEYEFRQEHDSLFNKVDLEEDLVYFIMQETTGLEFWQARFYTNPLQTNEIFTWSIGAEVPNEYSWNMHITAKEWSELLLTQGFDFVYLFKVDEQFKEDFGILFYNQEDIRAGVLVRVTEEDGRVLLKKVEGVN
jgi:hypothetical protein